MGISIEDTIKNVEALYQSLTGSEAPVSSGTYAPVPPEADLMAHIEAQLLRLETLVAQVAQARPTWSPPMLLWEDDTDLVIQMEVAGVPQNQIDVSRVGQQVTISGHRELAIDPQRIWINEQNFGPFSRTVLLPSHVDVESMRLVVKKGLLQLRYSIREPGAGLPKGKRHN